MHILIAGGSGLIGQAVAQQFLKTGNQVTILTREAELARTGNPQYLLWNGKDQGGWSQIIESVDGVINLAGESIGSGRWTEAKRSRIVSSRVNAGAALTNALQNARQKPKFFIQASAIGAYGTDESMTFSEDAPYGKDFLAETCRAWETSTAAVKKMGVRHIIARIGVVLDREQGALPRMVLPIRLHTGGPLGNGDQWISWVSLADVTAAFAFFAGHSACQGIFNITSPNPVSNREFGKTIGEILHRPFWLPLPGAVLRLMLGEMSVLVLEGQKVLPNRLMESGYSFLFPDLEPALRKVLAGV